MGISNLLRALESIQINRHLSYYKGMKMAVDGYCWLHKSVYSMTNEIFENPNSKKYLAYLIRRLDQLLKFNIHPIIIFDGDKLPMKKMEEEERERRRSEVTMQSISLRRSGLENLAKWKRVEGIDINPKMAYEFIKILKMKNIEFFVAPYEADIQLCYLSKIGYVDCVLTEDSDLLALGCPKVLFKLNSDTNFGKEIELKNLKFCKGYDFSNFDDDKFLTFCILSGCDYFKIKGVGIKNAYNTVKNSNSYKKCILSVSSKVIEEPSEYNEIIEKFEKAFLTFRYQVVYCPLIKKLKYYDDIYKSKYKFTKKYMDDLKFLGNVNIDNELVQKIVYGEIDPITHFPFEYNPKYNQFNKNNNNNNKYLNKKRILKKDDDYDEFNLDINLDIRNNDEENEKSINPQISTGISSPDLKKNNEPITISDSSSNDKNSEVNDNSFEELNEFDDFLNSFDKTDKKLKQNTSKENIEKIQIEYNEKIVKLINIDDLNNIKENKEDNIKENYFEKYKFNPEEYIIGNIN